MHATTDRKHPLLFRLALRLAVGILGILPGIAVPRGLAQQPAAANPARITRAVDDSALITLKGNVHPLARSAYDVGPANASLPAERMQLVLQRSSGQEIALRQFLGAVHDPNSPQYRKWLTPEQLGARYGVADADIQTVSTWLASQGFKVNKVNKARTVIEFSGSVGQVQSAFHTQIHNFTVNGEPHLANITDPQIPAALAPVVAGLSSLNNFFPKAQHTKPVVGKYDKTAGKLMPQLTTGSASAGYQLFLVPGDAATIYDTPNSFNTAFKGGTAYTGAGVTIGIAGVSNIAISDVTDYRSLFGESATPPSVVVDGNDPGVNGGVVEALLDLEVSGGLAPDAAQILYIASDTNLDSGLFLGIVRALDDNAVDILNVSFGQCEEFSGTTGNEYINGLWEQAAAQGITVTVSAGDGGSAGCDNFDTAQQAQYGLQVNGYASTPFNIAVGGTDFDVLSTDFTKYVSPKNSSNFTSALGYIPEEPWNNSTTTNGLLGENSPFENSRGETNIIAASGGASSCVFPEYAADGSLLGCGPIDGTGTGWPKPSWQTGSHLNIPSDGVRDLPDLSLFSANGFYGASWAVCYSFTASDGTPVTCAPDASGEFRFIGVGGTSASAPAFAGILALISQSQGGSSGPKRLGQANYVLYNLANQPSLYSSIFHDTISGNNSVYCASGSPDCGSNLFETGYNTGTEYDQASGLGSVDVTQLINDWTKATFVSTTTSFTINGGTAPVSVTHGQYVMLSATVSGAGGNPTGQVRFVSDANQEADTYGANAITYGTLDAGGTTGILTYTNLPGGTYTIAANYSGDISFTQSLSNAVQVTVAKEDSVLNFFGVNGAGNQITISGSYPYGDYFSLDARPVGVSQVGATNPALATGTVTFTDTAGSLPGSSSTSAPGAVAINSNGYAELPVYYWPAATHTVSASYGGDNSFNPSTASLPITFTITPAPTTSTVTSSASTVTGSTFKVTSLITPNPASFATPPTGTVTLTANGSTIGTSTVSATFDPNTRASLASATITASASSLTSGANTITASYSGDANYIASSGTVSVTYTPVGTIALTSTAATVSSPGQSGSSTITITPTNYTGTVNLACALTSAPSGANATYNPTCSLSANSVMITSAAAGTATATFATTSPTTGALAYPKTNRWYTAAGGAVLACVLFFGIPARRRGWRSMLGLLVFLIAMAGAGCGGGGGGNHNPTTPGTTIGAYTFTVTGTDSVTSKTTGNTVVTVTVN